MTKMSNIPHAAALIPPRICFDVGESRIRAGGSMLEKASQLEGLKEAGTYDLEKLQLAN
jgi:hypothetical protein